MTYYWLTKFMHGDGTSGEENFQTGERCAWEQGKDPDRTAEPEQDQIRSDQSLSRVRLFATPWITARQASLSITNSQSSRDYEIALAGAWFLYRSCRTDCVWHWIWDLALRARHESCSANGPRWHDPTPTWVDKVALGSKGTLSWER